MGRQPHEVVGQIHVASVVDVSFGLLLKYHANTIDSIVHTCAGSIVIHAHDTQMHATHRIIAFFNMRFIV